MPNIKKFRTSEHYYATFFHELAHWTMHKSRLNRPILQEWNKTNYYKEELCAELTASFLCPSVGIEPLIDDEHAPYLSHYIDLLKDDPKAFMTACAQAEKAADFLKAYQ
jgi:antirestriction protein ArdC